MNSYNRRNLLKQLSLGITGLSLSNFDTFAHEIQTNSLLSENLPIRLISNENPYGPSPLALKAMSEDFAKSNRYNWELSEKLISLLASKQQVKPEHILLGAGSTEIIDLGVKLAALEKGNFVIPNPSYAYWAEMAQKFGLTKIEVELSPEKRIDLVAMKKAINSETRLVYICNPNNPTATVCQEEELSKFIDEVTQKTLVFIDEAYLEFTPLKSMAYKVLHNKNLIIAKTFSKIYGLAGARIGYGMAHPETITKLSEIQSWANGSVSVASTAAAISSLNDEAFAKKTANLIEEAKRYTISQLTKIGLVCVPSSTNFIYFSLENYPKDYFKQLESAKILGTRIYEEKGKWTRITVGTMQEMQAFVEAIK